MEGLFYFVRNPQSTYTEWGWEIWPQGLTDGIMMIKARYGDIPIYITENGLGAKDPIIDGEVVDDPRIDYLSSHIGALEKRWRWGRCARLLPRSFIDLLSWLNGYQKQYGFVYVDHQQNLARKRKKSFIGTNLLLPVTANSVNLLLRAPFGARSDFRIFLNFSLLFKAGFAPCHGFI
nr:Aryl-phospho-beta-D-glucosidase BglC [Klebsiella pneumoniae]